MITDTDRACILRDRLFRNVTERNQGANLNLNEARLAAQALRVCLMQFGDSWLLPSTPVNHHE